MSSICSSVSYSIKKETTFNFQLKAMRVDEAICEAKHNGSDIDSDKSSTIDGNLYI